MPCGRRKARRLYHRLRQCRFRYFVTLTAKPHGVVGRSLVREFNLAWRVLAKWLRHNYNLASYVWSNEIGDYGHLHKHLCWESDRVSYARVRKRLASDKHGLGVVCDFKPLYFSHRTKGKLNASRAVSYCTKYLSKAKVRFPRYCRTLQSNVRPVSCAKQDGWKFLRLSSYSDRTIARLLGGPREFVHSDLYPELALIQDGKLQLVGGEDGIFSESSGHRNGRSP